METYIYNNPFEQDFKSLKLYLAKDCFAAKFGGFTVSRVINQNPEIWQGSHSIIFIQLPNYGKLWKSEFKEFCQSILEGFGRNRFGAMEFTEHGDNQFSGCFDNEY